MPLITMNKLTYAYTNGNGQRRTVLDQVSAGFEAGRMTAVLGPSGTGKSTLLSLLGGLDMPSRGSVVYEGTALRAADLAAHRRDHVAFVFQNYNLIDYLSALENVALACDTATARTMLERLGFGADDMRRNVMRLSGGQQQRVAIARALGRGARLILADEPTGNLDEDNAERIAALLAATAHDEHACVVAVTHSKEFADHADVVYRLNRGRLRRL